MTLDGRRNEILGIIGPAQSGKTTLLRVINRTIDDMPGAVVTGTVKVDGEDVRQIKDVFALRRKIGMVAPLPVGLPLSIFDNVAFAPRMAGIRDRARTRGARRALPAAGRALGRGQGPAGQPRHQAVGRPAAAADHRPRLVARSGDPLPGRVLDRHRSGHDHAHRGRAEGTAVPDDDHPGHQPRAAGAPAGRPHRLPAQRRTGRGRSHRGDLLRQPRPAARPTST